MSFMEIVGTASAIISVPTIAYLGSFGIPNWLAKRDERKRAERRAKMTPKELAQDNVRENVRAAGSLLVCVGVMGMISALAESQKPAKQPARPQGNPRPKAKKPVIAESSSESYASTRYAADAPAESVAPDTDPMPSLDFSEPSSRSPRDQRILNPNGTVAYRVLEPMFGEGKLVVENGGGVSHRIVDSFDGDALIIGNDGEIKHRITNDTFSDDKLVIGENGRIDYRITTDLSGNSVAIDHEGNLAYRITE